jgi:hypothetical protein
MSYKAAGYLRVRESLKWKKYWFVLTDEVFAKFKSPEHFFSWSPMEQVCLDFDVQVFARTK